MSIEIKTVEGLPDYASIIELIKAEWPEQFGQCSDEQKISDMIESHSPEKDRTFFLCDGDEVIGFSRYSLWPRDARETSAAHTYDISVLPSRQKQGLGLMLMENMIADCRARGLDKLLSRSFKDNAGSIRLHQKTGFRNSMETDDSIVWELNLKPRG